MKPSKFLVFLVAAIATVFLFHTASATQTSVGTTISYVEVNSAVLYEPNSYAFEAGETLHFHVVFSGPNNGSVIEDARVTARLLGEPAISDISNRMDLLPGQVYSVPLTLTMPHDVDPSEVFVVEFTVESNDGTAARYRVSLQLQRSSYQLEILSVDADSRVHAGETLPLDIVVKNRGRHEAEDTFVEARIPELGISKRIFLKDLSSVDQSHPDKDDSGNGRILLAIPSDAPAGLYNVEVRAFTADSQTLVTKRVEIIGGGSGVAFASSTSKTFAVKANGDYSLTLVNSGERIMVYTIVPESDEGLQVTMDDAVVAVPAGSSKTVMVHAMASRAGDYTFKVNVHAADGSTVATQTFMAKVEGTSVGGNAAVVLTIVLAIIFVVLLVVLIVLITRKPVKAEELSESYY